MRVEIKMKIKIKMKIRNFDFDACFFSSPFSLFPLPSSLKS